MFYDTKAKCSLVCVLFQLDFLGFPVESLIRLLLEYLNTGVDFDIWDLMVDFISILFM